MASRVISKFFRKFEFSRAQASALEKSAKMARNVLLSGATVVKS
jgi:hypothetical protein